MAINRRNVGVIIVVVVLILVGTHLFYDIDRNKGLYERSLNIQKKGYGQSDDVFKTITKMIAQRNNFSRALNLKQQKIGQSECEIITKSKDVHKVSSSGGWCAQTSIENSTHHKTDHNLATTLADFFKGKYVASFGDGPGRYKQLLLDSGLVKGYDAYDGAPFSEKTSEGRVQYLDLTLPQYGLPLYDWVMSLEVAEHIPKEHESTYIDNVVRHAKEGVVLSWAKLGQQGYSHVNNRPFEYVKNLMDQLGFDHDPDMSTKLQKSSKLEWLQWNTNVYRRRDLSNIEEMKMFWT